MPGYYGPRRYGYRPGPGWGRGYGRGWCWWPRRPWCGGGGGWGPPPWAAGLYGPGPWWAEPVYASAADELADLKEQEAYLKRELAAVQRRLTELEQQGAAPESAQ